MNAKNVGGKRVIVLVELVNMARPLSSFWIRCEIRQYQSPSHVMATKACRLTGLLRIQHGHRRLALHIFDDRPTIARVAIGGALLARVRGVMCHGISRG